MPEALLKFKIPDEQENFNRALNGEKYLEALIEIRSYIHDIFNQGHKSISVMILNEQIEEILEGVL